MAGLSGGDGTTVALVHRYAFDDGSRAESTARLRFRAEDEIRETLAEAGFAIEHLYGGWKREPVGRSGDGELVVVARAS